MDIPYLPPICPLERCPAGTETETKEILPHPTTKSTAKEKKVQKKQMKAGLQVKPHLAHWKEAGKSEEDIQQRLSQLPLMRELVKHPAEIWEDEETGRLTYLASAIGRDGKKYIVGFTPGGEEDYLETFWPDSKRIGKKRQGKKIFPSPAVAPST